jgi:hypothetical protein
MRFLAGLLVAILPEECKAAKSGQVTPSDHQMFEVDVARYLYFQYGLHEPRGVVSKTTSSVSYYPVIVI